MAANEYYNLSGNSDNNPFPGRDDTAYNPHTYSGASVPPYTSQPAAAGTDRPQKPSSPFDTPFDDHVYPLDSHQQSSYNNMGAFDDQSTAYHSSRPDDIPLRPRPPPKDVEMGNDHVYNAPSSGRPTPVQKKKRGNIRLGQLGMFGSDNAKRIPWVVYIFSIVQVAVFIGEVARNVILTGSPIMTKPVFNPMIGPSTWVLVNMGARYVPCMHNVDAIQGSTIPIAWPCPNSTTTQGVCSLSELCGFGGVPEPKYDGNVNQSPEPNQWFRFITPIFMHAGLVHIAFNLLLQLTISKEMERGIGSIRFFLVYMSAGIFGNVMGANYAGEGIPSTGASGALFGIIALILLDLLYSWQERRNPIKDLLFILLDIVIAFVLGLLPGLDNFAHIGGFIMGLALGICVLHSPNALRKRLGHTSSYSAVQGSAVQGSAVQDSAVPNQSSFLKNPTGFFKGRKPAWWVWWMVRAGALLAVTIGFILLLQNFYEARKTCSWCKYLSCVPISNWCEIGDLTIIADGNNSTKRDVLNILTGKLAL